MSNEAAGKRRFDKEDRVATHATHQLARDEAPSGWATGAATFASCMLLLVGTFQVIAGLTAVLNDEFFVVTRNYTFDLDVSVWGWIHLLFGVALCFTGAGLWTRRPWAGVTAIVLAGLSAVANFFFLPYYPLWAIVVIALDVWVIWALTRPGVLER
jgi:hypothetical protein